MKYLLFFQLLLSFLSFTGYGQDTTNLSLKNEILENFERLDQPARSPQQAMEVEISRILVFNMGRNVVKDSVAFHAFSIKVSIKWKNKRAFVDRISSNSPLCYEVWPNLNELLKKNIDFNVFLEGRNVREIIIPVGILVVDYDRKKPTDRLELYSIPSRIELMMDSNPGHGKYKSVYLAPKIITVNNRSSH